MKFGEWNAIFLFCISGRIGKQNVFGCDIIEGNRIFACKDAVAVKCLPWVLSASPSDKFGCNNVQIRHADVLHEMAQHAAREMKIFVNIRHKFMLIDIVGISNTPIGFIIKPMF